MRHPRCAALLLTVLACGGDPTGGEPPADVLYHISGYINLYPDDPTASITGFEGIFDDSVRSTFAGPARTQGISAMATRSAPGGAHTIAVRLTGQTVAAKTYQVLAGVSTTTVPGGVVRTQTFPTRTVTLRQGDTLMYRFTVPVP